LQGNELYQELLVHLQKKKKKKINYLKKKKIKKKKKKKKFERIKQLRNSINQNSINKNRDQNEIK